MTNRRALIGALGASALAASLPVAAATDKRVARLGMLGTGVNSRSAYFFVAFEQRLRELGYLEGQNCWRRPNIDPLCRLTIDPGTGAAVATCGCG